MKAFMVEMKIAFGDNLLKKYDNRTTNSTENEVKRRKVTQNM